MGSELLLPSERKAVFTLAFASALRLFGMFLLLPVLALHLKTFADATPEKLGFALGVYGLMQAILQIPLGALSDRLGRKPIILAGLIIFFIGSVVAASAQTLTFLIIGRMLQGAGAISSTVMATVTDVTRPQVRSQAMGIVGLCIGFSFVLAMIVGPLLDTWAGLPGLFSLTAFLTLFAMWCFHTQIKIPPLQNKLPTAWKQLFFNPPLFLLYAGTFCLHAILTLSFIAFPILLKDHELQGASASVAYLALLCLTAVIIFPLLKRFKLGNGQKNSKPAFFVIGPLILAAILFALSFMNPEIGIFMFLLLAFFCIFNLLEALLPTELSMRVNKDERGAAMGIFSSFQFLGAFLGGLTGGLMYGQFGVPGVFLLGSVFGILWSLCATFILRGKKVWLRVE